MATPFYNLGRIALHDQIKRHAHFVRGRVLDIGAGTFSRYRQLFAFNEYLTMDRSAGEGIDQVGTVEKIPFPDQSFDSIVCTQVLGDVYSLPRAFGEMHRVLKPGGRALITESLFDALHDEPHDYWRFTEYSLHQLAEGAGFAVRVLESRGGYHTTMAQMRARYWIERWGRTRSLSPLLKLLLKSAGVWARWREKNDQSHASRLFPRGYLLIAQKHA